MVVHLERNVVTHLACHIRNAIVVDVTIGSTRVTSIARPSVSAVDESLHGGNHIAVHTLRLDLEAVSQRGKCGMCPARSTVH